MNKYLFNLLLDLGDGGPGGGCGRGGDFVGLLAARGLWLFFAFVHTALHAGRGTLDRLDDAVTQEGGKGVNTFARASVHLCRLCY